MRSTAGGAETALVRADGVAIRRNSPPTPPPFDSAQAAHRALSTPKIAPYLATLRFMSTRLGRVQ